MAEDSIRVTDAKEVKNWKVHVYCPAVCFGAIALGYDVSVMGGTLILPSFERDFGLVNLSEKELNDLTSNILSAFQAGMFFGALGSYYFAERFGRKRSLCGFTCLFMVGAALMTGSTGKLAALTYFFFGSLMICMGFWAMWCIRETKGLSLEDMDKLFGAPHSDELDEEAQKGVELRIENLEDAKGIRQ
ncbi:General substrate transporter [Macrophomina phaseolina MS6]|uniref:General substrate transporter n=1 Tax=Macrophomina phaseolina (strain MS6) TaxID=1126212 RepID=K2RFP2_MACPH|nr:General substrate transporter [Macrophomina phaseolina MS6]